MSKSAESHAKPSEKPADKGHEKPAIDKPQKKGAHDPIAGSCFAVGCKAKSQKFDFCDEHFDHFKFGLIKKSGQPVPDYEKKIEHYLSYKKKLGARKVA